MQMVGQSDAQINSQKKKMTSYRYIFALQKLQLSRSFLKLVMQARIHRRTANVLGITLANAGL
jgi:hypothetical protein